MEQDNKNGIQIELPAEVAQGIYSNGTAIAHSPNEFILDFIALVPHPQQAKVQARIFMTPENVKNLFFALRDNLERYESTFGVIEPRRPKNNPNNPNNNPFKA
jgi:hypothetical protein